MIVYHFMFEPNATAGCPHCSLRADGFNGIGAHLKQRDVTMIAVSRAPYTKLAAYQKRMGWNFHCYSCYDRGNDKLNIHYYYLDLAPKGRDESGRGPFWVRRHDENGR